MSQTEQRVLLEGDGADERLDSWLASRLARSREYRFCFILPERISDFWQRIGDDLAKVKAVVTSQYGGEDPKTLSAKLHRIVRSQFHGEVTLD